MGILFPSEILKTLDLYTKILTFEWGKKRVLGSNFAEISKDRNMLQFFSKYKFLGIVLLVLSVIVISIIYSILKPVEVLPVWQPSKVNAEMVDPSIQHQKKYHMVGNFSLTNQNGKTITQDDYEGKIYVADFFFTTCQTICPIMTDNMEQLQEKLKNDDDVFLLSHTVMPEYDTPERLKAYSIEKGVDDSKWNLVTGDKAEIYNLARKQYLAAKENPGDPLGLVHTENFVLVDKQKRVRGFYDGTVEENMDKVLNDIKILQNEGKKSLFFGLINY